MLQGGASCFSTVSVQVVGLVWQLDGGKIVEVEATQSNTKQRQRQGNVDMIRGGGRQRKDDAQERERERERTEGKKGGKERTGIFLVSNDYGPLLLSFLLYFLFLFFSFYKLTVAGYPKFLERNCCPKKL